MIDDDEPPAATVFQVVAEVWGVTGQAERLSGGEESAAYRLGDHVVRIGPAGHDPAEARWCHAVALFAARLLPEAVAPLPAPLPDPLSAPLADRLADPLPVPAGTTLVQVAGHPVSVWPYAAGAPLDAEPSAAELVGGARLLARLHRALADLRPPPRPRPAFQETGLYGEPPADAPELADPELDRWLAAFHAAHPARHPLHGDYHTGNVLFRHGAPVAVLDWDEAFTGAPEVELAAAAAEWGEYEPGPAKEFVAAYHEAGGTAGELDDETLAQLVRHKIRRECAYFHKAAGRGDAHDEDDLAYHHARLALFRDLRP
ncbi:phosphotransferase enzyme family protein [Nonomuraea sp. NPDC047897]|uniref:phosphotransferase enzyme family protein n=1 Tax=Nonomuraea sp. NPDC047897 TaxID=3364346 RepID=UPI0037155E1F